MPFCQVLQLESWDAPKGRFFAAYTTRDAYRWLLGHAVVDEFATVSSPIFVTPRALLGKIYNAGMTLVHRRDPEAGIDLGWPPLCVGLDRAAPELSADWEDILLHRIMTSSEGEIEAQTSALRRLEIDGYGLERVSVGEATFFLASAPLLPQQLRRVCEVSKAAVTVSVATGNRLGAGDTTTAEPIRAASERLLRRLLDGVREMEG